MFSIYGGAKEFNQWELNQLITNPCMKKGDEVVFYNSHGATYVVKAFEQGGEILADVPNYLLQMNGNILVDLGQGLERHTECRTTFSIVAQDKPEGYKCEYNIKSRTDSGSSVGTFAKPFVLEITNDDVLEQDCEMLTLSNNYDALYEALMETGSAVIHINVDVPDTMYRECVAYLKVLYWEIYEDFGLGIGVLLPNGSFGALNFPNGSYHDNAPN